MAIRRRCIRVEDRGDVTIVSFIDTRILGEYLIQIFGEELYSLPKEGRTKILLNLKNVEYFSNAALGKLVILNNQIKKAKGRLVLCNISEDLYEVFVITRLDKILNIEQDYNTAIESF
jgi:anti-sigma B factor antagonist